MQYILKSFKPSMFEATLQHSYASLPPRCVDFLNHIFTIPHLIQTYPNLTSCDAAMHKNISQHIHGSSFTKAHGFKLLMQEVFETLLGKVFQLLGRSAIHLCLPRRPIVVNQHQLVLITIHVHMYISIHMLL